MMNIRSMKNSGFTLTELMVVIVILCCLATWVPFAWLVPDKPKDLKAIEHLRAHAYVHQMYFSMYRDYPTIFGGDSDYDNYARILIDKNPAISTRLAITDSGGTTLTTPQHSVGILEGQNGNLNQLTLEGDNSPDPILHGIDTAVWEMDACEKNSPIDVVSDADFGSPPSEESSLFCELDDTGSVDPDADPQQFRYRTIAVGHGEDATGAETGEGVGNPALYSTINGEDVMIPHRCLGVLAPSGAIYVFHIGGGDTLSSSHIAAANANKAIAAGGAFAGNPEGLLAHVLNRCEDSTATLDPSLSLQPGF